MHLKFVHAFEICETIYFNSKGFKGFKNRVVVVRSEHSEIMVDTDYFFDVSFKTFRLVLEPSSVEI